MCFEKTITFSFNWTDTTTGIVFDEDRVLPFLIEFLGAVYRSTIPVAKGYPFDLAGVKPLEDIQNKAF